MDRRLLLLDIVGGGLGVLYGDSGSHVDQRWTPGPMIQMIIEANCSARKGSGGEFDRDK